MDLLFWLIVLIVVLALLFLALQKALSLFPGVSPTFRTLIEILALLLVAYLIWHYAGGSMPPLPGG